MRYLFEMFLVTFRDVCTQVQIIINFFFVCQSVGWLTSLLIIQILGYHQVWIKYLFENFWWRQDWDVGTFVPINPDLFVCLLICYFRWVFYWNYTDIGIFPVLDKISLWKFVWRYSWRVFTLYPTNFEYCVCLSVC